MENNFLSDCLTIYIEREIVKKISSDPIINNFDIIKDCIAQ